jgi:formate dehydrogenase major subunit
MSMTTPEIDHGTPARVSDRTVTLQIDGTEVCVPAGTSVMRAAVEAGVQVPKLCATDSLEPFGSCRLCLVEVEGRKGYPASCTTPVEPGMQVRTQSPKLHALRRNVMELYISDHPLDCLTCSANGDCELQDMAGQVGLRNVRYGVGAQHGGSHHLDAKKDESNPYFTYDASKCIVCNRCVRACEETQGTFALTISGRGFGSRVSAGMDEPFMDSECVSCGACVQACPTATLQEKSIIRFGQPEHSVITTCAYCGVGCGFKADMQGTQVVRMTPWKDGKANEGHSCVKGRFAWGYATHPDRITQPMVRASIDDPWQEVSWEVAINLRGLRVPAHPGPDTGKDSIGGITSSALHQRGDLPRAEADPRGLRQQQRGHLRARLPFAHRLRPGPELRHLGRHADLQASVDHSRRGHGDRRQPDRGAPGVRVAHEAAAARQADPRRCGPDRGGPAPAPTLVSWPRT